jgi:hypothetical protein
LKESVSKKGEENVEINKNIQSPNLDQLSPEGRNIYFKQHEFKPQYDSIIAELTQLANIENNEESSHIIAQKKKDLAEVINRFEEEIMDVKDAASNYIDNLLLQDLTAIDSAYERLYRKIINDIRKINNNTRNRTVVFDVLGSYNVDNKRGLFEQFGKKSPYISGKANLDWENDKWTITSPGSTLLFRDVDPGDRMITFPVMIHPAVPQDQYVTLFSFEPLVDYYTIQAVPTGPYDGEPLYYLAEIMVNGDLCSFKGLLKSTSRKSVFIADYGISYDLPFYFEVSYDNNQNRVFFSFKYDETIQKYTSILKFDVSIHLLVGKDLEIGWW